MDPSPDILRLVSQLLNGVSSFWSSSPFAVSQMLISPSVHQTKINLPLINHVALGLESLAGVRKDALQRPVAISQDLTSPAESLDTAIPPPSRLTDMIEAEVGGVDSRLAVTGSVGMGPISQNLINPSSDDEMREEENVREVMKLVCPRKVLVGWWSKLVMSQT